MSIGLSNDVGELDPRQGIDTICLPVKHFAHKSGPFDPKKFEPLFVLCFLDRRISVLEIDSRVTGHIDEKVLVCVLVVSDRLDEVHVHLALALGPLYLLHVS